MTDKHQANPRRGGRRLPRLFVVMSLGILLSVALTVPAWGAVRAGKTLTVFHEIDMVSAAGYAQNSPVTVEVLRNGVKVGTATGPAAINIPAEGFGVEVNHGPLGAPQPGDCWAGVTPDILPGDTVRVTGDGGTDTTVVADVRFTSGPVEDAVGNITLEGVALRPDGTAIALAQLAGEVRQQTPRFRAEPDSIQPVAGTPGGWRATYSPPFADDIVQEPDPLTEQQRRSAILGGDHSMTYTANLREVQIADFPAANGPAAGCEDSPQVDNAVTSFDDRFINLASGTLTVGGTAAAGTTSADVTLRDGNPTTPDVTKPAVLAGDGPRTWSVTFLRGEVHPALADGVVTASVVATPVGGGVAKTIRKDTVAPTAPRAAPRPGIYQRPQLVSLEGQAGTTVRYRVGSTAPITAGAPVFVRPIRVGSTRTIRAAAFDAAGNRGPVASFRYVIR